MPGLHHTSREDIVITGMACRFAQAPDLAALWRNILTKKSCFTPAAFTQSEESQVPSRSDLFENAVTPAFSASLDELYACNPGDQYFPQKTHIGENPDLFFTVQLVIDALRDVGRGNHALPTDRVSFRLGYAPPFNIATVNWLQHTYFLDLTLDLVHKFFPGASPDQMDEIRNQLVGALPAANPYAFLSGFGSALTAWTSHFLGFAGPACVLDAGAVSGIQALQCAMDDLRAKRCDIALAGAIQPPLCAAFVKGIAGVFRFSATKTLRPFCRESDGTLPGEGGVIFVLKRLKDALRQNDRIYAIIRSTGIAAAAIDQQKQVPTPERLTLAMRRAFEAADVTPESVQMIEANGSGIPHSDQTEIHVLQELYGERRAGSPLVGVGSVKGNIGHTLWAASAAGVVKAALSIYHQVLPPQVTVEKPYARLYSAHSPICLMADSRPWLRGDKKNPRRACVTALDFSGTCAAAILEEYPGGEE